MDPCQFVVDGAAWALNVLARGIVRAHWGTSPAAEEAHLAAPQPEPLLAARLLALHPRPASHLMGQLHPAQRNRAEEGFVLPAQHPLYLLHHDPGVGPRPPCSGSGLH